DRAEPLSQPAFVGADLTVGPNTPHPPNKTAVMIAGQTLTMKREMPAAKRAEKSRQPCAVNVARAATAIACEGARLAAAATNAKNAKPAVSHPISITIGFK